MLVFRRQFLRLADRPQALDQHRARWRREANNFGERSERSEHRRVAVRKASASSSSRLIQIPRLLATGPINVKAHRSLQMHMIGRSRGRACLPLPFPARAKKKGVKTQSSHS